MLVILLISLFSFSVLAVVVTQKMMPVAISVQRAGLLSVEQPVR